MISCLEGKIIFRGERFVILETGGIGYRVFVGAATLSNVPKEEKVKLWTHLHVREDAMELYGFLEYAEMEFFEALIQISGVGPKSALGVVNVASLDSLKAAIAAGEITYLTKVSGIGKKIAEKIIIELRDKLGKGGLTGGENAFLKEDEDVLKALHSLGYSYSEARDALQHLPKGVSGTQERIKEVLKNLGKS